MSQPLSGRVALVTGAPPMMTSSRSACSFATAKARRPLSTIGLMKSLDVARTKKPLVGAATSRWK